MDQHFPICSWTADASGVRRSSIHQSEPWECPGWGWLSVKPASPSSSNGMFALTISLTCYCLQTRQREAALCHTTWYFLPCTVVLLLSQLLFSSCEIMGSQMSGGTSLCLAFCSLHLIWSLSLTFLLIPTISALFLFSVRVKGGL